jgi:PAS domain S-box-containing protein
MFDNLIRIASRMCDTPIALMSLIDVRRQWFKAKVGLDLDQTEREIAFCDHTIRQSGVFEVPDAVADARFSQNPLVTGRAAIRFYAGVPLLTPDGYALGALCVIDRKPRELTPEQRALLTGLACQAMLQLEHRRLGVDLYRAVHQLQDEAARREETLDELQTAHRLTRDILAGAGEGIIVFDSSLRYAMWNRFMEQVTGLPATDVLGHKPWELFPELRKIGIERLLERALRGELVRSSDLFIRHRETGRKAWAYGLFGPRRDAEGRIIGVIGLLRDVTERKEREAELERSRERLRQHSAHLQSGVEAERARIAREIHDELGARLTALRMGLSECAAELPDAENGSAARMKGIIDQVNEAIRTVRSIATRLRPSILDTFGLWEAIEWQAQEFEERTHIACSLALEADDITLSGECATAVFRIVQEALTNAARHAKATEVRIAAEYDDKRLVIEVRDNGQGISEAALNQRNTFGLVSMEERARIYGGNVVIGNAPGGGAAVVLALPLAALQR